MAYQISVIFALNSIEHCKTVYINLNPEDVIKFEGLY